MTVQEHHEENIENNAEENMDNNCLKDEGLQEAVDNYDDDDDVLSKVQNGLSQLGTSANGTSLVFLNLVLVDKNLQNLLFLKSYPHLQILDVSHNFLSDLSGLEYLPHVISLNVANNQLANVFGENSPGSIREANFSSNDIKTIGDLSRFPLLNTLLIDNNSISDIQPLEKCRQLKNLSLSSNQIEQIQGLNGLPLKQLDLGHNLILKIENIELLKHLQYINLSNNKIKSLKGLQDHPVLEEINLENNEISDMSEIDYLKDLMLLRILNLNNNPIQERDNYRLSLLFKLPFLVELDSLVVAVEEKVSAVNQFNPSKELVSSNDYMENLMLSYQQPVSLCHSSLSTNDPYPMLIIAGPLGLSKKYIAQKLSLEYPQFFGYCVGHTTRPICEKILHGGQVKDQIGVTYQYHTKDDFDMYKTQGYFLQTCSLYGNHFGITRQAIDLIAEKGLACVLVMGLEGVMTMKKTHFEPCIILMLPKNKQVYRASLEDSGRYNEIQIDVAMNRVEMYTSMHQEHPGYFDDVIITDDIDDRYMKLRSTVLEYVGVTPPNTSEGSSDSLGTTMKAASRNRFMSREKVFSSSPFPMKVSSGVRIIESEITQPPAVQSSYERRYEKSRSAILGVTSSFNEQIRKINTPASVSKIPPILGCNDFHKQIILSSSFRKQTTPSMSSKHLPRRYHHGSLSDVDGLKNDVREKSFCELSSSVSFTEESDCVVSETSDISAEVSSSDISVL